MYAKFVFEREKIKETLLQGPNCFVLKNLEVPSDALKQCLACDDISQLRDDLVEQSGKVQEHLQQHYQRALTEDKSLKRIGKEDPYL